MKKHWIWLTEIQLTFVWIVLEVSPVTKIYIGEAVQRVTSSLISYLLDGLKKKIYIYILKMPERPDES